MITINYKLIKPKSTTATLQMPFACLVLSIPWGKLVHLLEKS